jgi:hypothetical protein
MSASHEAIRELLVSTIAIIDALAGADQQDLASDTGHGCAYGGNVRQLIATMVDHEEEHAGQLAAARHHPPTVRTPAQRLIGEWMQARVRVATQLVGLDDEAFRAPMSEGEWTYEKAVRHLVDLQRHVLETLAEERAAASATP